MIKRHMPQYDTLEEADDGDYVLFTDHESAIAAKDAEIGRLRANLDEAIEHAARGWGLLPLWKDKCQSIAEKVRERCAEIADQWMTKEQVKFGNGGAARDILSADLSDITGKD